MATYVVTGGSEEERIKAIAQLTEQGHVVVSKEEAQVLLAKSDLDVIGTSLVLSLIEREPDSALNVNVIERPGKKVKGHKAKFQRQPWQ